jgi:hypothetical protein
MLAPNDPARGDSARTVTWFLRGILITACAALAGSVASIVLLFFKRSAPAHRVAKRATLLALVVLGVAVAELQVILRVLPAGDPSTRARALAEGISEVMNCSALALAAVVLGGVAWFLARRHAAVRPKTPSRTA